MASLLTIEQFLLQANQFPVLDARSPSEYKQGHIPGAYNIPLLDDEVRKQVGTTYKNKGKEEAVRLAFELAGPHFHEIITEAKRLFKKEEILIHCWRGGLRSSNMAWILEMAGFKTSLLKGGYKSYRNWALNNSISLKK